MRLNYTMDVKNAEVVNAIIKAIEWEKYDMLITLNEDAQKKQESIINDETSTEEDVEVANKKLAKLIKEWNDFINEKTARNNIYKSVLEKVSSAKNEYTANDRVAFRNILRLSSCDEDSKFFKIAIVTDNIAFDKFYDTMVSLHDMDSKQLCNSGLRNYNKKDKEKAMVLANDIQSLIKVMFSVPIENEMTKKINVKFNKSDLNAVHETFVIGLSVDMTKSKKTGIATVDGVSYRYAINKTEKKGVVTYTGAKFKETLAKLAFVNLFK